MSDAVLTVPTPDDAMAAFNSMPVMNATPAQNDSIAMNHAAGQTMTMDAFDQDLGGFDEALMYVPCSPAAAHNCLPARPFAVRMSCIGDLSSVSCDQ